MTEYKFANGFPVVMSTCAMEGNYTHIVSVTEPDYIERQDSCKSCGATDYDFDGKVSKCTYCDREYTEIAG